MPKLIEVAGPEFSLPLPVQGDGGRERVIEILAETIAKNSIDWDVSVLAASGSKLKYANVIPLHVQDTRNADHLNTMIYEQYGDSLFCDILHVHHPEYLSLNKTIRTKKIILSHHGVIEHSNYVYADGITWVSHFLRDYMLPSSKKELLPYALKEVIYNPVEIPEILTKAAGNIPSYIGFMGALAKRVKRLDIALEVSHQLKIPLKIAGPCPSEFVDELKQQLHREDMFLGELKGYDKLKFLQEATCMICPNDSPEAFCLVAAESLSVGTPVLASSHGGLPEVIKHGFNGYICKNIDEYVCYFNKISLISPKSCLTSVEKKFNPSSIAEKYLRFFERVLFL